ncbi:hypothetical protein, partial [Alistipes putredinis]
MEDSLHLKTEPILIFVNDFLNVMARFGITSDEELFLLLCYYSQTQMDGTGLFIKWWTDARGAQTITPIVESLVNKNLLDMGGATNFNLHNVKLSPDFVEFMEGIGKRNSIWLTPQVLNN